MKLVMTLLVRNEEDIICQNLDFHFAQGVDHIIVTNNLSDDGTRGLLESYEKSGRITLLDEYGDDYSQSVWVTKMARMACSEFGADWVINNDADEFWFSPDGRLLCDFFMAIGPDYNLVQADRHDMVCLKAPENALEPFYQSMIYRKRCSVNSNGVRLPPKVAHRSCQEIIVSQGNHDVSGLGCEKKMAPLNLEILHYPIRSRSQFLRKIRLGGAAYARNAYLPAAVGSTWRRMYDELVLTGRISHLESSLVSAPLLRDLLANGSVLPEERLASFMQRLYSEDCTRS